jgi:rhodanese-related sulfurtransferase
MKTTSWNSLRWALWVVAAIFWAGNLRAITVTELQAKVAGKEKLTIIDVRSPSLFRQGHIPGAINVPASLCPYKQLPPLGQVVVYGEGLGKDSVETAAGELAQKPGLTVAILQGGFAEWESSQMLTTRGRGLKPEMFDYITYEQLKNSKPAEMVLVDLRKRSASANQAKAQSSAPPAEPLTDLATEFPGMKRTTSPLEQSPSVPKVAAGGDPQPVLVLVDNGDGAAEALARKLRGNGQRRVVILVGGEIALARKGRPGLQRSGGFSGSIFQTAAPAGAPK